MNRIMHRRGWTRRAGTGMVVAGALGLGTSAALFMAPMVGASGTPTITTHLSTTSVVLNYPIGSPVGVTDQVTVTGEPDVTGLNVYVSIYKESGSPPEPGSSSIAEWQVPLDSNGMAATPPYIPESAGTFCYQARFIGDDNDTPIATTICEILTVTPFPASLVTVPGAPVTTGSSITLSDAAEMTIYPTAPAEGGSGDYGSVVFRLYSDPSCHDFVSTTSPAVIAWTGTQFQATGSLTLSSLAAGTYYWIAAYPGNYDNLAYTSTCGEPVTVSGGGGTLGADAPTITTQLSSGSATAGGSVTDTATLSGASPSATGAITISMYSGSTCSALVTSQTATPATAGNGTYSATFSSLTAGSYEFQASFAADSNDSAAMSSCGSEPLTVTAGSTGTTPAGGQLAASVTTPTTGADISGAGLAAVLCLFLGSILLVAGRQVLRIRPQ
ncbi:MAG: hypothetical protein WBF51_00385 [Candidatus Dormiibacterota bacterium]